MLKRFTAFLDERAVDNWRLAHKLWSVRIAIFWAAVAGLWIALPAFTYFVPAPVFALVSMGFSLAILFARLTHQPGLPSV